MKIYTLILLFFFAGITCFSQATFKDASGDTYQIKELSKTYNLDSCSVVCAKELGWRVPDPQQFKKMWEQNTNFQNNLYYTSALIDGKSTYILVGKFEPRIFEPVEDINGNPIENSVRIGIVLIKK